MLLPGSPATYANRAYLGDLGLQWDPANHRSHGTTTPERVKELRKRLGLEVRVFGVLESAPKGTSAPKPPSPASRPVVVPVLAEPRDPTSRPRFHDYSRTRLESRITFPGADEDAEEITTPTRKFSWRDVTSGLPDDCREEVEREEERRLRYLRGRVKAARAVVSATPGLAEILAGDWIKAARFYARFGITEGMFVYGVPRRLRAPGGFSPKLPEETFPEALRLRFGLPSVTWYRLC